MIIFMTTVDKKTRDNCSSSFQKNCLLQLAKLQTKSKIFSHTNSKQQVLVTYDETLPKNDSELCKSTVHITIILLPHDLIK
jgi:hypothetical protein